MALPGPAGASPQPSRTTRASDGSGSSSAPGPAESVIYLAGFAGHLKSCESTYGCLSSSARRGDDRCELVGIEARAAYERAVDVGLDEHLGRVRGGDAAAV